MILPLFTPSLLKRIAFEIISVPLNNSFAAMITFRTSTQNFFYIEQWRNIVKFIGRKNSRFLHINTCKSFLTPLLYSSSQVWTKAIGRSAHSAEFAFKPEKPTDNVPITYSLGPKTGYRPKNREQSSFFLKAP